MRTRTEVCIFTVLVTIRPLGWPLYTRRLQSFFLSSPPWKTTSGARCAPIVRDCAPFACRYATSVGRLKRRRRGRALEQAARAHVQQAFRERPYPAPAFRAASTAAAPAPAAPLVLLAPAVAQVSRGCGGRAGAPLLPLGKASGGHQWQRPMSKSSWRRLRPAGSPEASFSTHQITPQAARGFGRPRPIRRYGRARRP